MERVALLFVFLLLAPTSAFTVESSDGETCECFQEDGVPDEHNHQIQHDEGGAPQLDEPVIRSLPNNGCDIDWKYFDRSSGGWCIKVFGGSPTRNQSEAQCQSHGATLSGLQNSEEIKYITKSALQLNTSQSGNVWIGAERTAACLNKKLTSECTRETSFRWTDGSATGTEGFVWDKNQPDNAYSRSQRCVVVLASATGFAKYKGDYTTNYLDDVVCDLSSRADTPKAVLAFACGKRPRVN